MTLRLTSLAACAAGVLLATDAAAQTVHEASILPLKDEPAPTLTVDAPLPEPLSRGVAVIPYRAEHFRILPVFGAGAVDVSPRVGHLHVGVDDTPWRWADANDIRTVIVAALPAGPHKVVIELATPDHRILLSRTVAFVVPDVAAHAH